MTSKRPWNALKRGLFILCVLATADSAGALETTLSTPGASSDLRDRIAETSSVLTAEARGLETPLELLSASLSDYRTLVQILYDEGYFSPVVSIRLDGREAANIDPLNSPAQVNRIDIAVQTGPAFRFGTARIAPLARGTELPDGFARGAPANTSIIQDAARAGVLGWKNVGHAKADIGDQRITARHSQATLDTDIELLPGPKLTFGRMFIQGDSDVRARSIERIAGFPTGEIYSPDKVQRVGTRLRRTGTFSVVSLQERETPNPDGSLDFDATFEDMPKRRFTFGVEISSREGLDVSTTWLHRNLFGGAERLRFEASIRNIGGTEDIDGRIGLRLDQPDRLGPDDSTFYVAEIERRNRTHYNVTRAALGYGARRTFSDRLYAEASVAFAYADADDAYGEGRKFRYLVLPLRSEWDERDSKVSATRGFYLDAQAQPFLGLSDSDSGLRLYLDGRGYWDIGTAGRLVLAGRVQVGSVIGPSADNVSPDFLFFSGGAGTVRGQAFESLGIPVNGQTAGGRSFLGLSAEVRGRVTDALSLVGFYDYGAVDSSSFVSGDSAHHSGAGLGVRYDLGGFGPLRFDLAYPVQGPDDDGLQFYIGIGQAF
ncbi:autotransporter assembly complex family protein [Ruegeria sp. HKCCD8929]|uniref:autotransporter assembly complex protein TamA n=1 Tax=Ruegeria sp. HKCCD8929 TaxID=2683006 RepID=UPI001489840C|nr:BamA/TamA family outer membrane protein [Ruegeria sp. HKCCD8929]